MRGDFATAFRTWESLAEQGDVDAQFALGAMYGMGRGVAQDHVTAHMGAISRGPMIAIMAESWLICWNP